MIGSLIIIIINIRSKCTSVSDLMKFPGQLSYQLKRGNDQEKPWSSSLLVKLFRLRQKIERNVENCRQQDNID